MLLPCCILHKTHEYCKRCTLLVVDHLGEAGLRQSWRQILQGCRVGSNRGRHKEWNRFGTYRRLACRAGDLLVATALFLVVGTTRSHLPSGIAKQARWDT